VVQGRSAGDKVGAAATLQITGAWVVEHGDGCTMHPSCCPRLIIIVTFAPLFSIVNIAVDSFMYFVANMAAEET
jgi:hypothetical protein